MHHQTYIAGVKFRPGASAHLESLEPGTQLGLLAESTNPHDPNAVQVWHGGMHVGYVPRDLAPEICRLIAEGRIEICSFVSGTRMEIHFRAKESVT